jgi:hypothetical protein
MVVGVPATVGYHKRRFLLLSREKKNLAEKDSYRHDREVTVYNRFVYSITEAGPNC